MRVRHRQAQVPTVNLVPMMDVLMTVLTFFIIISMSLTGQQLKDVTLPSLETEIAGKDEASSNPSKLEVGLSASGDLILKGETATLDDLKVRVLEYLIENPQGAVVLKADRELPYQKVAKLLEQLNKIGGGRVSLVVDKN